MKYYLIAGEASGDLHGSNLMKALKNADKQAQFRFLGGDLMIAQGGELVKHYSDMAFMGFVEVALNLRTILKNLSQAKEDLLRFKPDALVLIDFPGFNMKIAEFAKKHHIKVFYYISPKVWAWNQKRVLRIKKVVDHLFCILPFEVDFYRTWGMEVDYVGNPLLDAIADFRPLPDFREKNDLDGRPLVALLPGSRKQEISKILPDMLATAARFPDYQFVIAGAPNFGEDHYQSFMTGVKYPVVFNQTYDLLSNSEAAVVASGTATLETALFHIPEVVVYKANGISIAIARLVIKIRFISLVNLIMDKEVVKELIQQDCNPEKIGAELHLLLKDTGYRNNMLQNYQTLSDKMGEPGASQRTAEGIVKYLKTS
ncbi:lipid-A-disaccharide synthase [Pararcticibacter amylolyticus]|uniref:Lipid-A-disaccharide synthase n=1 Tax=Pararcticibacter amylolyticus TaxID=2173175 RepID=A0A2U2PJ78_9SPHI|nr:lipid-A-disaccharide synthase [Pararcticibacter amylolyticus]PWG81430.1 lipid-A-disaccharide synthase [Pararcticibacter amylolyticus]